jgi:hypothetical protein
MKELPDLTFKPKNLFKKTKEGPSQQRMDIIFRYEYVLTGV